MKKTYHCHNCKLTIQLDTVCRPAGIPDPDPPQGWDYVEVTDGYWAWLCDRCLPKVPHA